jgi:chemotaxis protein histidine kinase CheA
MKKYKSVRNGQIAELVSGNEKQVVIRLEESGEERKISPATLKRWWKPMEDEVVEEQPQSEEVAEEAIQEEATETVEEPAEEKEETPAEQEEPANEEPASEEPKQEETKSEKKTKTEKASKQKRETILGDHPLKAFIEQLAVERGTEVFKATVPSFRSLKVDGKMYMAFTFNKKGITLWMRSKAVQDLTQFKKTNHMFDARVHFDEETKENKEKITKLLDASLEFQKNKQAGKASK